MAEGREQGRRKKCVENHFLFDGLERELNVIVSL